MDFPLKFPFDYKGEQITSLTLRRPKPRDLLKLDEAKGSDGRKAINMIADLAEREPDLVLEMDVEDLRAINAWLEPLLDPNGQASGGSGS